MFGWDYNEKLLKDYIYNHAKDFGRLYCELMMDYPILFKQFMEGFYEEHEKRSKNKD